MQSQMKTLLPKAWKSVTTVLSVIQKKCVFLKPTRTLSLLLWRMTQPNRTKKMITRSPYSPVKRSHICHLSTHQRDAHLTVHLKMKCSLWEMAKEKEKVTTVSRRTTKGLRSAQIGRTVGTTSPTVRGMKTSHMSICHSSQSKWVRRDFCMKFLKHLLKIQKMITLLQKCPINRLECVHPGTDVLFNKLKLLSIYIGASKT